MPDARGDQELRFRGLAEEQAALRRVATLVARGVGPAELFSAVSDEVARLFGAEAVIARFDTERPAMLVVGLTKGIPVVSIGTRWELEDFLASSVVYRTGRAARNDHTGHVTASGPVAESLRQMNFVSTVAAPIVVAGRLWGVMTVSDERKPLPSGAEERVERFTELVAMAIANAESRAALDELVEEQAALGRVATLVAHGVSPDEIFAAVSDELGRLFAAEAGVARFEPDGSGSLEDIFACTEVQDDPVSTVAAPIIVGGQLWGAITVADMRTSLPADAEARVDKFAELVATAVANAESRAELAASEAKARGLAREQAGLRRVATLVANEAGAGEIFAAVAREVADVLGIPVVAVQRFEPDRTFTVMGIAGETTFTVGSRWPIEDEGLAGLILATGRPARKDDYTGLPGPLAATMREDMMIATVGVPIVVEGGVWGFMVGAARPGRPIPDGTEERLARFTELVATAIANSQAREHLAASRARIVAAADDTRRRIERDLHDGAQQRLVTLAVALRRAEARIPTELDDLKSDITRVTRGLTSAVEELREISRGIHPSILTEGGLAPALKALGRRSAVRVKLDARVEHRLPDPVEVAAYYTVSEALTNTAKHAHATRAWISLRVEDDMLRLSIRDDGVGGADVRRGSGLTGLVDRIEALGGRFHLESPAEAGTRIDVGIPVVEPITRDAESDERRSPALTPGSVPIREEMR